MEIHKPKPWHGWREFLKEYLIIVVGVLTALAAESGVEWLHWQHLADKAETDLAGNLETDLLNAGVRVAIHPCTQARVAELSQILRRGGPTWAGAPLDLVKMPPGMGGNTHDVDLVMPEVIHTPVRYWSRAAWDSAVASGVLNHMPRERVDAYALSYALVGTLLELQLDERRLEPQLAALAYDHEMSGQERTESLKALAAVDRQAQATETAAVLTVTRLAPPGASRGRPTNEALA